jgi:hypothetical protein
VSVTIGVSVIVSVSVIVGVSVTIGVSVIVSVSVIVGVSVTADKCLVCTQSVCGALLCIAFTLSDVRSAFSQKLESLSRCSMPFSIAQACLMQSRT